VYARVLALRMAQAAEARTLLPDDAYLINPRRADPKLDSGAGRAAAR
jgi:hypothetical protein